LSSFVFVLADGQGETEVSYKLTEHTNDVSLGMSIGSESMGFDGEVVLVGPPRPPP
jgi:hypothetical protein